MSNRMTNDGHSIKHEKLAIDFQIDHLDRSGLILNTSHVLVARLDKSEILALKELCEFILITYNFK